MSPRELKPCGTYAAYYRHRRAGEEPCEACKKAKYSYSNEKGREYQIAWRRARDRALARLARRYADEFKVLFEQEKAKEGRS